MEITLNIAVRFARPDDYRQDAASDGSALPFTGRQLASDQRSAEQDPYFRRVVAAADDKIVGACAIRSNWAGTVQPGRLWVTIDVAPQWRGHGLGSRMLHHGIAEFDSDVAELGTCIREDRLPHADFLAEFGFEERFRSWGAHLDLTTFDPAQYDDLIDDLRLTGISLVPYEEIESEENYQKLVDLNRDLDRDVRSFDPIVPSAGSEPIGPDVVRAGLIVALDEQGDFVGMACLRQDTPGGPIDSGLTGVRREHRGRGIATALKARSLAVAKELGATETGTGGGGTDSPMKRLNQKLGYKVEPDWVTLISRR